MGHGQRARSLSATRRTRAVRARLVGERAGDGRERVRRDRRIVPIRIVHHRQERSRVRRRRREADRAADERREAGAGGEARARGEPRAEVGRVERHRGRVPVVLARARKHGGRERAGAQRVGEGGGGEPRVGRVRWGGDGRDGREHRLGRGLALALHAGGGAGAVILGVGAAAPMGRGPETLVDGRVSKSADAGGRVPR